MKRFSVSAALSLAEKIFLFVVDMIWKLWITSLAAFVICAITLFIAADFACDDLCTVPYYDYMVPAMNDRIDYYFVKIVPWVLVIFLGLLVLYKRVFEQD